METFEEKRATDRVTVLKAAKIEWGNSVVDCLVLEQSPTGVRVSMATPMDVPKQVTVHLRGGAVRQATLRWAFGTEVGFEFCGIAKLDAAAADSALLIFVDLHENGLNEIIARLNQVRFFDDAELTSTALAAQAAMQRLETMLRQRAESSKT